MPGIFRSVSDEVGRELLELAERLEAVGGGLDRVALVAEELGERRARVDLVVDYQDASLSGHVGFSFSVAAASVVPERSLAPSLDCAQNLRRVAPAAQVRRGPEVTSWVAAAAARVGILRVLRLRGEVRSS